MSIYTLDTSRGEARWLFSVGAADHPGAVALDVRAVGLRSMRGQAWMSATAAREMAQALTKAADIAERKTAQGSTAPGSRRPPDGPAGRPGRRRGGRGRGGRR
jgi:hypothetical protein